MVNPVSLSSGAVIDSTSAFNDQGVLKLKTCPLTKKKLTIVVHPIEILKKQIHDWNKNRLEAAIKLAEQYKNDQIKFLRICDFANELLSTCEKLQFKEELIKISEIQMGSELIMNDPQRCG